MSMTPFPYFADIVKKRFERRVDSRDPGLISMSSLGHCTRQLAYRHHGVVSEPFNWRTMAIFADGDMAHTRLRLELVNGLIEEKSCYRLEHQESEVELEGIVGHVDGMLMHDSSICQMTQHKDLMLEVKSMNDRAFSEAKKTGEIGYEYRCQLSGYLAAAKMEQAVVLLKNKNNSDLLSFLYTVEHDIIKVRLDAIESVIVSNDAEEVPREYGPNARGNLPWQCGYCPFVTLCWRHEGVTEKKEHHYYVNMKQVAKGIKQDDKETKE